MAIILLTLCPPVSPTISRLNPDPQSAPLWTLIFPFPFEDILSQIISLPSQCIVFMEHGKDQKLK